MPQRLDAKHRVINTDLIREHVQQVLLQLVILLQQLATVLFLEQPRVIKIKHKKEVANIKQLLFLKVKNITLCIEY